MVRAAVLRGKDPQQLLLDLEKIDQMGTCLATKFSSFFEFVSKFNYITFFCRIQCHATISTE